MLYLVQELFIWDLCFVHSLHETSPILDARKRNETLIIKFMKFVNYVHGQRFSFNIIRWDPYFHPYTVLVKGFTHLNGIFFLASLEEICKLWKWWTVYVGVLQLTNFLGMIICDSFWVTIVAMEACLKIKIALGKCMKSVWWNDTLS